jgi:hypothetical protein
MQADLKAIAGNRLAVVNHWSLDSNDPMAGAVENTTFVGSAGQADIVTSITESDPYIHTVVLDIDMEAKLVPSSTEGHYHLYIDKTMGWDKYVRLLEALAEAGILEPGYVGASIARGFTAVRLPWVKKETEFDGQEELF